AAEAIGKMGPAAKAVAPQLAQATKTKKNAKTTVAAAEALWKVGQQAELVVPALLDLLKLREIPNPIGLRFRALQEAAEIRKHAAFVLGTVGPVAKPAVPTLRAICEKDEFLTVREAARDALLRIDPDPATNRGIKPAK